MAYAVVYVSRYHLSNWDNQSIGLVFYDGSGPLTHGILEYRLRPS